MASINLATALSDNERNALPVELLQKLQTVVDEKHNNAPRTSTLIANIERDNTNLKMKLQMSEDMVDKLRKQLRDAEDNVQQARRVYFEKEIEKEDTKVALDAERRKSYQLSEEKVELTAVLDRRVAEVTALEKEMNQIRHRLELSKETNIETSLKAENLELSQATLALREARVRQENDLTSKRLQSLNAEVTRLSEELTLTRNDRTKRICELQSFIDEQTGDLSEAKAEIAHLKRGLAKKDEHIGKLALNIKELRENCLQLEESYQSEIKALNNLVSSHKFATENERKKKDELIGAVKELQVLLHTAQKANEDLEHALGERANTYEEQLNTKESKILALEHELEMEHMKASDRSREELEKEMDMFFPSAASASRVLRSNASFSQVSEEYPILVEKYDAAIKEIERLRLEISRLVGEAEDNAPLFHGKVMEHKKAIESITQLQNQLATIVREKENWFEEKDSLIQRLKVQERNIARFKQENVDLSNQVRHLINSVKESRGMSYTYDYHHDSVESESPANRVISAHLVTFKDIEELQVRNQQLLSALRDLSESQEANESSNAEANTSERDRARLNDALRELTKLREDRKKQAEKIESLIKQRDAFEQFVNNYGPLKNNMNQSISSQNLESESKEVEHLKEMLQSEKEEHLDYKTDAERKFETFDSQISKLQAENLSLKVEEAKAASSVESLQSQIDSLTDILDELKTDNATLNEKNIKFVEKNKQLIEQSNVDKDIIKSLKEDLKKMRASYENMLQERDSLRSNEVKLTHEIQLLKQTNQVNSNLADHLKSLQSYVNRLENDGTKSSHSYILVEKLQQEICFLKTKLEGLDKEHDQALELERLRASEIRRSNLDEVKKNHDLEIKIKEMTTKLTAAEREVITLRTGASAALARRADETAVKLKQQSDMVTQLSTEISKLNTELSEAKSKANDSENKCLRFANALKLEKTKNMSASKSNTQNTSRVAEVENELLKMKSELECNREQLQEVQVENTKLQGDLKKKDDQMMKIASQARQRIAELQKKVDEQSQTIANSQQKLESEPIPAVELSAVQAKVEEITKEKDELKAMNDKLRQQITETQEKSKSLEDSAVNQRLKLLQNKYAVQFVKLEKELTEKKKEIDAKNKEVERCRFYLKQYMEKDGQTVSQLPIPSIQSAVTSTPSTQAAPVQPVLPTPQAAAPTKSVASIRPLANTRPHRVGEQARTATVASEIRPASTSQPARGTAVIVAQANEESSLPSIQTATATVLPTQSTTPLVVVAPTSNIASTVNEPASNIVNPLQEQPADSSDGASTVQDSENAPEVPIVDDVSMPSIVSSQSVPTTERVDLDAQKLKRPPDSPPKAQQSKRSKIEESSEPEARNDEQIFEDEPSDAPSTSTTVPTTMAVPGQVIHGESNEQMPVEKQTQRRISPNVSNETITVIDVTSEEDNDEDEDSSNDGEAMEDEDEDVDEEEDNSDDDDDDEEELENNSEDDSDSEEEVKSVGSNAAEDSDDDQQDDSSNHSANDDEEIEVIGINDDEDPESQASDSNQVDRAMQEEQVSISEIEHVQVGEVSREQSMSASQTSNFMQAPIQLQTNNLPLRPRIAATTVRQSLYTGPAVAQSQSAYEDTGDSIVPSTPTLFVPRRPADGFAEAVNSPRAPQDTFVFSNMSTESGPDLAQLANEGSLRVDDTRMDLSQFGENNMQSIAEVPQVELENSQPGTVPECASSVTDAANESRLDTDGSNSATASPARADVVTDTTQDDSDTSSRAQGQDPAQLTASQRLARRAPIVWSEPPGASTTSQTGQQPPTEQGPPSDPSGGRGRRTLRVRGASRGLPTARRANWRGRGRGTPQ